MLIWSYKILVYTILFHWYLFLYLEYWWSVICCFLNKNVMHQSYNMAASFILLIQYNSIAHVLLIYVNNIISIQVHIFSMDMLDITIHVTFVDGRSISGNGKHYNSFHAQKGRMVLWNFNSNKETFQYITSWNICKNFDFNILGIWTRCNTILPEHFLDIFQFI